MAFRRETPHQIGITVVSVGNPKIAAIAPSLRFSQDFASGLTRGREEGFNH
jgi:hypothetical protein